jgi:hypothetical protein
MKINLTSKTLIIAVSTSITSLSLISAPTFAATLDFLTTDEAVFGQYIYNKSNPRPSDPKELKIGEVQGKAGGSGKDLFFALDGSNSAPSQIDSTNLSWDNGTTYNWTLDWNTTDNQATFSVTGAGKNLTHTYTGSYDKFNALELITRADTGFGATMDLKVDSVTITNNGNPVTLSGPDYHVSSNSNSSPSFNKKYFVLSDLTQEMTQLIGTFTMSWTGGGGLPNNGSKDANSEVGFYIRLYDPPQATPEPSVILGLLSVGYLGTTLNKKNQK